MCSSLLLQQVLFYQPWFSIGWIIFWVVWLFSTVGRAPACAASMPLLRPRALTWCCPALCAVLQSPDIQGRGRGAHRAHGAVGGGRALPHPRRLLRQPPGACACGSRAHVARASELPGVRGSAGHTCQARPAHKQQALAPLPSSFCCLRAVGQMPWLILYIILTMVPHHVTTYYMLVTKKVRCRAGWLAGCTCCCCKLAVGHAEAHSSTPVPRPWRLQGTAPVTQAVQVCQAVLLEVALLAGLHAVSCA